MSLNSHQDQASDTGLIQPEAPPSPTETESIANEQERTSSVSVEGKSKIIKLVVPNRSEDTKMSIPQNPSKQGKSKKGKGVWAPEQDELLLKLVSMYGENSWNRISKKIAGKSEIKCHTRWL